MAIIKKEQGTRIIEGVADVASFIANDTVSRVSVEVVTGTVGAIGTMVTGDVKDAVAGVVAAAGAEAAVRINNLRKSRR